MARVPDTKGMREKLRQMAATEFYVLAPKVAATFYTQKLVEETLNRSPGATGPMPSSGGKGTRFVRSIEGNLRRMTLVPVGPFAVRVKGVSGNTARDGGDYRLDVAKRMRDKTGFDFFDATGRFWGKFILAKITKEFLRMGKVIDKGEKYSFKNPF